MSRQILAIVLTTITLLGITLCAPAPLHAAVFDVEKFGAGWQWCDRRHSCHKKGYNCCKRIVRQHCLFPSGNYLFSKDLSAAGIALSGQDATLIASNSAELDILGKWSTVDHLSFSTRDSNINGNAIRVNEGATNFDVRDNKFAAGFLTGILANGASNGRIFNNLINVSDKEDSLGILIVEKSNNISVDKNVVVGKSTSETIAAGGIDVEECTNIAVTNNKLQTLFFGVGITQSSIINCVRNNFLTTFFGVNENLNTNVLIDSNKFAGPNPPIPLSVAIVERRNKNTVVSQNIVSDMSAGISFFGVENVQVKQNQIKDVLNFGIYSDTCETISATDNTIVKTKTAILLFQAQDATASKNKIRSTQNLAISVTTGSGKLSITNNTINDCGLAPFDQNIPPAVIFVNSPQASSIPIVDNRYGGNRKNLSYFIWSVQPQPPAKVSGNKTTSGLPNRIGSGAEPADQYLSVIQQRQSIPELRWPRRPPSSL